MSNSVKDSSGIIYGDQNYLLPSQMNYGRYLLDQLLKFKDKTAMIHGVTGEKITYSEMAQQIVDTAAALTRIGVTPGTVVAICSENRFEFMTTTIAVMYAGAVVTFLNPAYNKNEFYHCVNISKPRYLFMSHDVYNNHYKFLKQIRFFRKFIIFGDKTPNKMIITSKDFAKPSIDMTSYRPANFYGVSTRYYFKSTQPTKVSLIDVTNVIKICPKGKPETALILYSSGTTGFPKGAKLTHVNLIVASQKPLPYNDIAMLSVIPWCNCMGQITTTDALSHGRTIVFLAKFEEKLYLETIEKYKVGCLFVVPPLIVMLSKSSIITHYDVSTVEVIHCGGAPLNSDTITQVKTRFPKLNRITQVYGMSETTGAITEELENAHKQGQGSVGKIIPGNVIKIVDIKSRKILGPNQPGELCIKGLTLFEGYIGKPSELDDDGFYSTGDIVYYDDDGYFYVVDRLKELIKYKAWQVAPSELEALLLQHPSVKDVGVVGTPDQDAGELPTAFIVKQLGSKITEKELIDFVASKVSSWKRIRGGVRFVKEIPKTGSGKILRRQLREMLKTTISKL